MDIREQLIKYGKKIITLDELRKMLKVSELDIKNLHDAINDLICSGCIEAVKASGKEGSFVYPLYNKYRILAEDEVDFEEVSEQIKRLHPKLRQTGYLAAHPKEYIDKSEIIKDINRFLFTNKNNTPVSRKERSFEIFGKEKVLDDSSVKTLLRNLQITSEVLYFYDTPEYCYHDYIPERKSNMTLLVLENKDIWYNIRRCMFEDGYRSLFGKEIDGVVFGNGNKISQKEGALTEYIKFLGNPNVKILYWGDIDREGFDIYKRMKSVNPALAIEMFLPGYRQMIKLAWDRENEDSPSQKKGDVDFTDLMNDFTPAEKSFLLRILKENKLIPQEIIPYTMLKER